LVTLINIRPFLVTFVQVKKYLGKLCPLFKLILSPMAMFHALFQQF